MGIACAIYRSAARLSACLLGGPGIVESLYVHRSVATGEVSFARSDIDLMMIVRQPRGDFADGPELASLCGRLRRIQRLNPALSHVEVHDPEGIRRWFELDTYRASEERRSAILLRGMPVAFPNRLVRRDDAIRRVGIWADDFFSTAIRERNRRNLRKIALEIWCAYATATGHLNEPCLTRSEIAERCAGSEDAVLLDSVLRDPFRAPSAVFRLAKRLHDNLLPRLGRLSRPLVMAVLAPPRYRKRLFVILPREDSPLPREAFQQGSFVLTPELFNLCLRYMNPFLYWVCPPDLIRLGISPPTTQMFVRACLFYGRNHTLRNPGFMYKRASPPVVFGEVARHVLPHLEAGLVPPPLDRNLIGELVSAPPSWADYYTRVFPSAYRESEAQWRRLKELEERLGGP
jgi:hypothetical protein